MVIKEKQRNFGGWEEEVKRNTAHPGTKSGCFLMDSGSHF